MTGEKKSTDFANRLNVKSGKKLLSKTTKPSSSTISSPPKAAIASSNAKKEDVHRRRNINDILRRRSGDAAVPGRSSRLQDVALDDEPKVATEPDLLDKRMAERVAELERALSLAREEQDALREALEQSRRHRLEENPVVPSQEHSQSPKDSHDAAPIVTGSDSIMHDEHVDQWSDSRSSLKSVATADFRSSSPHSHDDLVRQNYDLRYKLAHLQDQVVAQDDAHSTSLNHAASHNAAALNDLRSRLHATEKESQERLQQLLSLKSSISSLTRTDAQSTDSDISDAFDQLAHRVREWVISNFRKMKLDVGELPADTVRVLRSFTPAYESIKNADRLALYQALVADSLMQVFDEPIVPGLPGTGPFSAVRVFAESMKDTGASYREWRRNTIRLIERNEEARAVLQRGRDEVPHRIAAEIAHVLFTLTSVNLSPSAQSALIGILKIAVDLQRTLALQKARYEVLFFRNSEGGMVLAFDKRKMETVNDLDDMMDDEESPSSSEHHFMFCVFPCLEKFGDEWGENTDFSNVLVKARVCCGTG